MINYIIFSVISFMLGVVTREIMEIYERNKKYKQVRKLNEQNFKQAINNLEIK